MARGRGFWSRLFKKRIDDDYFTEYEIELDEEEAQAYAWNWDTLINDRHLLKLSDDIQREKYIRSLVEQVRDASAQMDRLTVEYNEVTAAIRDVEELETLPPSEMSALKEAAERMIKLEDERSSYHKAKSLMTEGQYQALERFSETLPRAYEDIKNAEEQKKFIKEDLKKLDEEKQGYLYRDSELRKDIANARGMVIICLFAAILCIVMLLILQFGFMMDTKVGYIIVAFAVAISVTLIYIKYLDAKKEHKKIVAGINRIILLQNTVKIRYVNNKQLLDYLYMKYNTKSSKELHKIWDAYEEERAKREQNEETERQLTLTAQEYARRLHKYKLSDAQAWIHNPIAIINPNEMTELKHSYMIRRQKLRAQMDYNKRLAKDGEKELRQLIEEYPRYSGEVVEMLNKYQ